MVFEKTTLALVALLAAAQVAAGSPVGTLDDLVRQVTEGCIGPIGGPQCGLWP